MSILMNWTFWTALYVVGASVGALAAMAANLLASRPRGLLQHLHHLGRWAVSAGCLYALARVLTFDGHLAVWPEQSVLVVAIALVTVLAGNGEARKQERQ